VPELGGTVGYELNLFLQDYIEKQGHFDFDFGLIIYVILNLSSPERIQSFFENTKKEIKTDLGTNSGANTGGLQFRRICYNGRKRSK
jgi:S-DNA-T family DNA segregation ATPase FtsK/SpoIIIE